MIWRFPFLHFGVPPVIIHFRLGYSLVNHDPDIPMITLEPLVPTWRGPRPSLAKIQEFGANHLGITGIFKASPLVPHLFPHSNHFGIWGSFIIELAPIRGLYRSLKETAENQWDATRIPQNHSVYIYIYTYMYHHTYIYISSQTFPLKVMITIISTHRQTWLFVLNVAASRPRVTGPSKQNRRTGR